MTAPTLIWSRTARESSSPAVRVSVAAVRSGVIASSNFPAAPTWPVTGLPTGASFDTATGVLTWTPTYAQAGSYPVTLTVTDNQGATSPPASQTVSVTAPNQAPVVNAGPDESALIGLLYTENWAFSDPDNGPWSYTIDWGDGTTSSGSESSAGSFSTGHTYVTLLPMNFTVHVTVVDSEGLSGSDSKVVSVLIL